MSGQAVQRTALVCFDYEAHWGMPFRAPYDPIAGTRAILDCLDRHGISAVFFTVGALALEKPQLVREIARRGHEIALHGWRHEDLTGLRGHAQRTRLRDGLAQSAESIERLTGSQPTGFRAPYLLGPAFWDAGIYALLADLGYRWVSNREIRHVVELLRPDRIRTTGPAELVRAHRQSLDGRFADLLLLALNARLWWSDRVASTRTERMRWLLHGSPPFYRDGLLEIPVYTPLDCDLIGLPDPRTPTPASLLRYAGFALREAMGRGGPITSVTFHDWIVAGANRIGLLDEALSCIRELSLCSATVRDVWPEVAEPYGSRP